MTPAQIDELKALADDEPDKKDWVSKSLAVRLEEMAAWSFNTFGDQGYIEEFMEAKERITQLQSELAALKSAVDRDGKTLKLALAYAKLLPFYLERDDETEMAIDVDRFLQGNGVESSGYQSPTPTKEGQP